MVQFQNGSVVVELVNNATAIFLTWQGFPPSLQYREGLEKSLEIAQKHKIQNWMSDLRLLEGIGTKDQEWVGLEWLPKAVLAGCYKYQAVIMDEDPAEELSELNIITTVQNKPIEIQHFTSLKEAKQWLKKKV